VKKIEQRTSRNCLYGQLQNEWYPELDYGFEIVGF